MGTLGDDVVAPRRRLVPLGIGLLVAGVLVVGACVGLGVVRAGPTLTGVFTAEPLVTPVHRSLTFEPGRYAVFQRVRAPGTLPQRRLLSQEVEVRPGDRTRSDAVVVRRVGTIETVTRGDDIYEAVVGFEIQTAGEYFLLVGGPYGQAVFVARAPGDGLATAARYLAGAAGGGAIALAGIVVVVVDVVRRGGSERPEPAWQAAPGPAVAPLIRLVLVRHGPPVVRADEPPGDWPLAEGGADLVRAMAGALGGLGLKVVVSSGERKAVETAEVIAAALSVEHRVDERLGEVSRPWSPDVETLRASAAAYLRGAVIEGWEPGADVVRRIDAAITGAGPNAVVVGHGTSLTAWLVWRGLLQDGPAFCSALTQPDAYTLDGRTLVRLARRA